MYKDKIYFENWLKEQSLSELELAALCDVIYETEGGGSYINKITGANDLSEELEDAIETNYEQERKISDLEFSGDYLQSQCESMSGKLNRIQEILNEAK